MDNENNKEKEGENADSKKVAVEAKTEDSDVAKQIEGEAKPDAAKKDEAEHAVDDFEDKEVEIAPVIVQEEDAVIISEDEESVITDVYDEEDFKSMALLSPHSTIPVDAFEPIHSYGYDCQHHYNICACDRYVVAWAAGSYITFYNIKTKAPSFRRSSTGGSIGHITKNPKFSHIAVGEGGLHWASPIIIIYQWPSMSMVAALRDGTKCSYANLDYSPDGNLLASVGGPPDYNLTIWDWQKHRIMLQTSAFSYTVNNVQFSPYIPGQLTTSGASHIKFWKMCPTFTGLKLKGELGRFGKTEICDILGVMPMPDEKVLSGCSWGNILVWENGLVKVEVCRRGRNTCHEAPITQFLRCPETTEVTTVGLDGCIRTWYWDTVEQADPPENDPTIELNPVAELRVEGAQLMSISQRKGTEWFGQDAGGCIWTLDLDVDSPECGVPERQVQWHGGPLVGLAVLRGLEPLLVSLGCDGTLALAPIPAGPLLYLGPSAGEATTMLYLPKKVDRTGRTLLIGYSDGTCRLFILFTHELNEKIGIVTDDSCLGLLQQLKPHKDKVNVISMNPQCSILVTVSMDCTLFMYQVQTKKNVPELVPLCYIDTPKIINYITWKPGFELVMLLAGEEGLIMEAELPHLPGPPPPDTITYQDYFASTNIINLKEYILRYTPPDEEDEMPYVGSDEEEEEKKESDEEEEEEAEVELFEQSAISQKSILWAVYDPLERDSATGSQQLWVAQEGLGCLLRIQPGGLSPNKFAPLEDSWEVNIVSMMFINENKHLVLGMEDGEVRLICFPTGDTDSSGVEFELRMVKRQRKLKRMRGKPKDEPELIPRLDFLDFLRLPMHNAQTGRITHMVFSHDERYFFTAGGDGNVFSYSYNLLPEELLKEPSSYDFSKQLMPEKVGLQLTEEELELSHEELAREKERQALQRAANQYKQRVRDQLAELTLEFKDLLKKNNAMPLSQQVEVEVDERVLAEEERVAEERMALVRRKMAFPLQVSQLKLTKMLHRNIHPLEMYPFQLNSILNKEFNVKTIRQNKLTQDFFDELEVAKINLIEAIKKAQGSVEKDEGDEEDRVAWGLGGPPAPLLQGLPPVPPPPRALVRALRNYLQRINRHHKQEMEWQDHLGNRSFSSVERAGAAAIADAEASIGEFHLKSRPAGAQGPTQPHLDPAPLQQAHVHLFITRQEIYEIQSNFNKSLVKLKEEKVTLTKRYAELTTRLAVISEDIPKNMRQSAPLAPPTMNPELEDPASNIKVQMSDSQKQRRSIASSRRRSIFFTPPPVIVGEKQTRKAVERDPSTNYWDMMKDESKEIRAKVGTPLEEYYKERHITSLLVEQEQIILEMKESVDEWEERLKELSRERERAQLKAHYLRLHLLYLTQRHLVLDSFQLREDEVGEQVRLQQAELKVAQDELKVLNKQIEHLRSGIAGNQETIRQLEVQQRKVAADAPKFAKFLRHIYKKKQKPPKLENDESSESEDSEEESSSEEEESEASDEGAETVRLRLDSTMCPPGCDPQIYEEIINFRQIRYDLENDIKEQERQIELSKKSVDFNNREARILVRKLEERQKVLYDLLQTKQGLLNDIECLVVVSASCCASDALEAVLQGDHACVRAGVLLFPAPLIAQLKDRIAQLHAEAMEQKLRHSINQSHLRHMKVDCKSMEQRLAGLRAQCQLLLTNKLNLHELKGSDKDNAQISGMSRAAALLDAVLGEMSYAFKVAAATGFTLDMQEQLAQWKKREVELEQQYCAVLQEHTEKLRIASALQAETLTKESSKTIKDMLGGRTEEEYRQDIVRLRRLRKEQKKQIEELKAEVHRLKLKPLSCQPALPPPPSPCATSISVPPTGRATPAPAPPLYDNSIKTVATTLATCLIESGLEVITDMNMDKCLLDEIADMLPFLVIGKLNISTATNRILKKLSLSCDTEENIIKAKQCKSCIADILRQIVKENLVLGEMSPLVQLARSKQREQEEGTKDVQRALVGAVVSLLELGASSQLVDAVVATLLVEHPEVVEQTIHAEELLEAVQDEIDISDEETGLDVVRTVISCILAQALEPGEANAVAEEIRELQKSASSVSIQPKASKSALRNVSSVVSTARSTSQMMKKVSVVDAKSEASVSAPAKGSRTSQGESAKGSNTSRQGQSAKGSKTSQKSDRT